MKKLIPAFLLAFLLYQLVAFAEPRHFSSQVSEVTVYLQGASVKRTAHVNLQQGNNEIILDGLSNYLDINSVRLESNSNMTILSVNAATNYLNPAQKSSEETALLTIADTLNHRLVMVQNEIAGLNAEMEMMKSNYHIAPGSQGSFVDALENTADFFDKRIKDILNSLVPLHAREKELTDKITPINAQLNEIHRKNSTPQGEITVTATSPGNAEADISFSYYVTQASWVPAYNMRAANDSSNILLDYDAEVSQSSGEDWNNVKMTLSTGNPSVCGVKPRLIVNRLDYENEQNKSDDGYKRRRSDNKVFSNSVPGKMNDIDVVTGGVPAEYGTNYASDYTNMNQNILATVFDINLKYNILSDGIAKHVRIQQDTLHAKFSYSAAPKLSTDVFLQADITGWEEYNLLPGEVNIFLENSFVGKSYIDPSITKDTLSVSFGRDKRINIRRTRVKNFTRNQFLGGSQIQSFGYVISTRNTKSAPVTVKIEDQIPVSTQKDIVVELLQSSGAELNALTGTLTWRVNLKPAEEKNVTFEYTVKYPKGKAINW